MKRSQGEGSIKEYKPGKWYARIRIKGKEHNFYGTSELEVTEKLAAFKKTLLQDSLVVPQEAKQPMNDNAGAVLPVEASDNLITVTELQKILKIGKDTAYTLVRSNDFPSIKIGGQYRILSSQLHEWLIKKGQDK